MLVRIGVAAAIFGVAEGTLRRWNRDKKLQPAGRTVTFGDLQQIFKEIPNSELGGFFRHFMDNMYAAELLIQFNDFSSLEVEKAGKFLELNHEEIRRWRELQQIREKNAITPHYFRAACAVHLLEEGVDIRQVQEIIGWKSLSIVQNYTRITPQRQALLKEQHHPGFQKKRTFSPRKSKFFNFKTTRDLSTANYLRTKQTS